MSAQKLDTSHPSVNNAPNNKSGNPTHARGPRVNPHLTTSRNSKLGVSGKATDNHPHGFSNEVRSAPAGNAKSS